MPRCTTRARWRLSAAMPALLALAAIPLAAAPLHAQYTSVPEPAAYALRNVTVVAADGRRTEDVNIVVRNGLIAAMGRDAAIPPGVRVLDGDSLMVYPGIVDAHGAAKFSFPQSEVDRAQVRSWDPPRELQGFTPHRRVADALTATGRDLADQRKKGVVAAAVHPEAGLMAGQGAVLMFRSNASMPAQLVVNPSLGQLMGFRGGRGVYPGTLFGVMAFQRQAFEDARRARVVRTAYERSRNSMAVPPNDPDLDAVGRVLSGDSRAYFVANSSEEIIRALQISDEYGFTPVIVGGQEAWKVADQLTRRNVPVLVSLDVPRPRRWKPSTDGAPMQGPMADSASANSAADDAFVQREKADYEAIYSNPGRLAQAGVRFALTSGGGAADIREGVRTAMRYGLSEAAALSAVTSTPATLLGIPEVVRVAEGAPATFVATNGPLFDNDTRVVYTFVEGILERGAGATSRAAAGGARAAGAGEANAAGSWDVEIVSDQGTLTGTMRLSTSGEGFSGSISSEFGDLPVTDGKLSGQDVSFTVSFPFMGNASASFTGTLSGDRMTGSAATPVGQIRWTANRSGPPGPGLEVHQEEDMWEGHAHGPIRSAPSAHSQPVPPTRR